MSGRRGSNPPPEAWKATALPNELLPLIYFTVLFLFETGLESESYELPPLESWEATPAMELATK